MAWRVVECGERQWNVSLAAERRAPSKTWNLVFSFRPRDGDAAPIWAEYPMSSTSRSFLLQQAERIPDARLAELIAANLR